MPFFNTFIVHHQFHYLPYSKTGFFSGLVNDYIAQAPALRCCYNYTPDQAGIEQAIADRAAYPTDRKVLTKTLNRQYQNLETTTEVQRNLQLLAQDNTYTVCTAHQPNLMTGYLYFVYKIIHAIKLAQDLSATHPDKHFVPVYYIGSEDNDLAELGSFRVGNTKIAWDGDGQTGAVGRMNTKSLKNILAQAFQLAGPPGKNLDTLRQILETAYLKHKTVGAATQYLCNELFGAYGLIVLDPDDADLKRTLIPIMQDDLLHHTAKTAASKQIAYLEAQHYKQQAFPRNINLFYLADQVRERIELQDGRYYVLNTNISFGQEELLAALEAHPERFSPNVILRGLLQETILPNVAFIGGGSEVAYWLQLKPVFDHYHVFFPQLLLRQSVQWIDGAAATVRQKLELSIEDLFTDSAELLKRYITQTSGNSWDTTTEKLETATLLASLQQKAESIDPTLKAAAASVLQKIQKQLAGLEQKMYRAEKKKHDIQEQRIALLKKMLFPGNTLQERYGNIIDLFPELGFEMMELLMQGTDPLGNQFLVIEAA